MIKTDFIYVQDSSESESESESEESLESLELEEATAAFLVVGVDAAGVLLRNENEISAVISCDYYNAFATKNEETVRTRTHDFAFSSIHSFTITSNEGCSSCLRSSVMVILSLTAFFTASAAFWWDLEVRKA